jgi:hypothetical protein
MLPVLIRWFAILMALVLEGLHGSDTLDRLLEPPRQARGDALRGFAHAGERLAHREKVDAVIKLGPGRCRGSRLMKPGVPFLDTPADHAEGRQGVIPVIALQFLRVPTGLKLDECSERPPQQLTKRDINGDLVIDARPGSNHRMARSTS